MRFGRLLALGCVALVLAPGTWLRSDPPPPGEGPNRVALQELDAAQPAGWPPGLQLAGAWEITGSDSEFGGFSALLIRPDGRFDVYSDFGRRITLPRPPAEPAHIPLGAVPPTAEIASWQDIEAVFADPASGTRWISYEHHNAIRRIDEQGRAQVAKPPAMAEWGDNSGGEAMAVLPDWRMLVLAEYLRIGLLFDGDPVDGAPAAQFPVRQFGDFRPTDMALLPDGRALVLLREVRWDFPPFASMLAVGDPADIRAGEEWMLEELVRFDARAIAENYEGLAVEQDADGALSLWLIADDNRSVLQRTLLLRLRWEDWAQMQTAREAAPREP